MIFPERQGPLCHRKSSRGDLAGAGPSGLAAVRKRGHHRAWLEVRVGVVQMIDGNGPVHQHGLLGHSQADYLSEKVHVFLRATRASRDVVVPSQGVIHRPQHITEIYV